MTDAHERACRALAAWVEEVRAYEAAMGIDGILDQLWCAATDTASSVDFRDPDGTLNEAAYLQRKNAAIEQAKQRIQEIQ